MAGDFQLRFDSAADFQRAWEESLYRGETFVPTKQSPLLGSSVLVKLTAADLGEVTLEAEVVSLELDANGVPGMRVIFGDSGREALRQLAAKLPAHLEDTRRRVPLVDDTGVIGPPPGASEAATVREAVTHFTAGQVIGGRFQVESLIGEGGMGEVYRAVHVYLKRPVALKTLQRKLLSDQEAWTRFQREAELVSKLESQHVVRVFDFGRLDDGQPFICMEFVEGEGLDAVLDRGPLEPEEAVTLLEQVAEGLSEAHALGIVHRDLKPPNIMLGKRRDGRVLAKILDFGIARIASGQKLERLTATGMVVGTPAYLAPEQAMGNEIDARTDIYALGCVAYEMLTGRPPFKADAIGQLLLMHINERPRPLEAFRPQLARLPGLSDAVLRALEKDPARRWQHVEDFTRALRDGLTGTRRGAAHPAAPDEAGTDQFPVENLPVITAPTHPTTPTPQAEPNATMAGGPPPPRASTPPPRASTPPPRASTPSRRSSAPLPPRATPLPPSVVSYGQLERSDALGGRLGRLGETLANLSFALSPERVAAMEKARAAVPEASTIGWVLVAEPMRTTHTHPAYAALLQLAVDVAIDWGGALDRVDEKHFTFLFVGSGSQGRAVLAAQELRERVEVILDGAPADAPVFRVALSGGRMTPPADAPLEGEVVKAASDLAARAGPGQVLLPSSFASAVSDLVETQPVAPDVVALVDRRPFPLRPVPVVGRELTVAAVSERLATFQDGAAPPLVVVGPRLSGRTTIAQEAANRARAAGFVVGLCQGTSSLAGVPFSALADVVCQLCGVLPTQRFTALAPVLERLPLTPGEREAVLLLTQVKTPLTPFTPRQAVHVLRRVLEAGAQGRKQVLIFDGLDGADDASAEAVRELCLWKSPRELVLVFSSPEQTDQWFSDVPQAPLPPLSSAEVARWLAAFLGHAPQRELQVGIEARARGLPGLLVDWTLLAAERGLLRPRGNGLALEGVLPALEPEQLPGDRLRAVGTRVARLVEATAALGEAADTATLARVLPGVTAATWQRLQATRLVKSAGGQRVQLASPALEDAARGGPVARRPALMQRVAAAVGETVKRAPMEWLRVARLVATGDPARAAQAWRTATEQALHLRSPWALMHAQAGWADAVANVPGGDSPDATRLRLELLARAVANAFLVRDLERARALLDVANELAQREQVGVAEHFLVASRLHRALGRIELASEALSQAMVLAGRGPIAALCLAEVGDVKDSEGDLASAAQAYEQALPLVDAAAPIAQWHGEADLRARVETRLGGVLLAMKDGNAKALLARSLARWRAMGAGQSAARVLANLGTLCITEGQLADAVALFGQAAATAEAAGDFLFQARQLVSLARAQSRASHPSFRQTADAAKKLATAVGWDEGVKAAEALLRAE